MLIDSHAHLADTQFHKDLAEVIRKAQAENVSNVIIVGDNIMTSHQVAEIADTYKDLFAAVGVHPHNARNYSPAIEHELVRLVQQRHKIVAIGEIGLDFHYRNVPKNIQIDTFTKQLHLAKKLHLPVIIHCREAFKEVRDILLQKELKGLRGVVHCFSGDLEEAREIVNLGFYIGITGIVTFTNSDVVQEVVKNISLGAMLIETDCPYLAPTPFRGNRNEPSYLKLIDKKIAEIKNLPLKDASAITRNNTINLFSLPLEKVAVPLFTYKIKNSLYINITNQCVNSCKFCKRLTDFSVANYHLHLPYDPSASEIINQIGFANQYDEIVFCGYGEPTLKIDTVIEVAKWLKENGAKRVRLNTNGLGNLINKRNIVPEISEIIDSVSISLNAVNKKEYKELCNPSDEYKDSAYDSLMEFVKESKNNMKETVVSFVQISDNAVEGYKKFVSENFDLPVRIRQYKNQL